MSEILSSMGIDVGVLLIFLMILQIVLIVLIMRTELKVKRLNRKYKMFMKGDDGQSLEKNLVKKMNTVEKYAQTQSNLDDALKAVEAVQNKSPHKYGIIKYDAFDDVGGKLSFVLALLDDGDSGFVLNAVHSRDNCFLYIKEILKGESYIMLSNEEKEALRIAKRYGSDDAVDLID